ncbi:MAG: hypothetical protein HY581_12270 [Nitrospirae bacterium]|nr:hypothetical protein [Nitrospirota bacterium]
MQKIIFAEDPEKTLWWRLGYFKNLDRVIPLIRASHNSDDNAKKQARQIRYCIEQAEEYFQAATDVSVATQPLLLYYGMASLAWALILFKKTGDYALDRQKPGHQDHGLTRPILNYGDRNLDLRKVLEAIHTTVPPLITGHQNVNELRGTFGLLFAVAQHEPVSVKVFRQKGIVTESTSRVMPVAEMTTKPDDLTGATLSLGRLLLEVPDMASPFGAVVSQHFRKPNLLRCNQLI